MAMAMNEFDAFVVDRSNYFYCSICAVVVCHYHLIIRRQLLNDWPLYVAIQTEFIV